MSSRLKILFCTGATICAVFSSSFAFAVTMGSIAPHDPPATGQATEQWISDPITKCVAGDPNYVPGDSISWQGKCRKDGVIYGSGTLTFLNNGQTIETVTGTFADGLVRAGPVTASWSDGTKYQGTQLGGLFNGTGTFVSAKGETHQGEWKMGIFQTGKASTVWPNGDRYDGEWKNGKPDGEGVEVWADGRRYEGQWRDGVPVGDAQTNGNASTPTGAVSVAANVAPTAAILPPTQNAPVPSPLPAAPAGAVASVASTPAPTPVVAKTATPTNGNTAPNAALPLRPMLGTQLTAVDGATLELRLADGGFERTLVLPNGNSQQLRFAFANGPVGTVTDGEKAIGVFRATRDELDIDYADGTTEILGEGTAGGLVDRAHSADNHVMCTAWYPKDHVFSQDERQAAVQEYASRLGVSVSTPSKKLRAETPACGGAFVASGSQQKAAAADDAVMSRAAASRASVEHAQLNENAPEQNKVVSDNFGVAVRTSAVQQVDAPNAPAPAHLENARFTPDQQMRASPDVATAVQTQPGQLGASDCLSVESNGQYWGFQNVCSKSVQFAYCEMKSANPLTSCNRTSVVGSVAGNGFSPLVSDLSLTEKNGDHEFRWMACNGGAGEVVPHLDKFDPPSGRCERTAAIAQ